MSDASKIKMLQEQCNGLIDQRDFAISEVKRVRKQRDIAVEALEWIAKGTRCVECGGEDQAQYAREAIAEVSK